MKTKVIIISAILLIAAIALTAYIYFQNFLNSPLISNERIEVLKEDVKNQNEKAFEQFDFMQGTKVPVNKSKNVSKNIYEFVGPICESTDKFVTLKKFQKLKEKDFIAICDVGAYGMSLSSNYNLRPKPVELLIKGRTIKIIKNRQKHTDLI